MKLFLDNDTDVIMDFDYEDTARLVIDEVLAEENCPFEAEVNLLLTDDRGIRQFNKDMRGIDEPTDVLSFPNLDFEKEGEYILPESESDYIDPETGLVILGDIVINLDRVISQAREYGHSRLREYAFLIAHSMLHLSGYDHMSDDEAALMESRQEAVLNKLGIVRD